MRASSIGARFSALPDVEGDSEMDDAQLVATVVAAKPFQPGATRMVGFRRRSWFFRVLLGETAGFVVPGLAWFAVWKAVLPPPGAAAIVALSGAAEGAALGIAQWLTLREWHAGFSRTWILASAAGASVAWTCGMTPSTAHDLGSPTWLSIALGVSLAPVLLLSLPGAQWLVLRRYVPNAWKWVSWSTAGWRLALPATFIGPAILPSDASSLQIAVTWAISGMAMAAIVAAFTGYAMSRILQSTVANLDAGTLRAPG